MIRKVLISILIIIVFFVYIGCGGTKETRIRGIWQYWYQDIEKGLIFHKHIVQPTDDNDGGVELKIFNNNDFDVQINFRLKIYCNEAKNIYTESGEMNLLIPKLNKPNDTFGYIKINIKGKDLITDIEFSEFLLSRL
jgi:hypothetical protein